MTVQELGAAVRDARKQQGLDQLLLADLAGVSERMSVPVRDGRLSTHLLKFGQKGLPRLIANERACLKALARARLEVNEAEVVVDMTGEQALLVTRFDRQATPGTVRALRQLDGCQAAGRYPADKYDLDTVDVVSALAGLCANPTVAALRLLEQVAASYLIGNGDLHAKNLSVFDRGVRAAALERVIDRLLARTKDLPEQLSSEWPRDRAEFRRVLEHRRHRLSP